MTRSILNFLDRPEAKVPRCGTTAWTAFMIVYKPLRLVTAFQAGRIGARILLRQRIVVRVAVAIKRRLSVPVLSAKSPGADKGIGLSIMRRKYGASGPRPRMHGTYLIWGFANIRRQADSERFAVVANKVGRRWISGSRACLLRRPFPAPFWGRPKPIIFEQGATTARCLGQQRARHRWPDDLGVGRKPVKSCEIGVVDRIGKLPLRHLPNSHRSLDRRA